MVVNRMLDNAFIVEMFPIDQTLSSSQQNISIEVGQPRRSSHIIIKDLIDLSIAQHMRSSQFISLAHSLFQFQSIQHCLSYISHMNGLSLGFTVIRYQHIVIEELEVIIEHPHKIVISAID